MKETGNTAHTGKKAQAMVEFAIVIPIVMVLVLAIFEFGRMIFVYTSISAASREAARYGSGVGASGSEALYNDCDGIKAAAMRIGRFAGVNAPNILIFHDEGPGTTSTQYCTSPSDTAVFAQDNRINVQVDVQFDPIVPLVNIPSFTLRSQNAHTILLGAAVVAATQPANLAGGQICDVTPYEITVTNPLGPVVSVNLHNASGTDTTIKSILLVWDTTSSPVLQSITGISGIAYPPPNPDNLGPAYSASLDWAFPTTPDNTFTITYSKALKNNVIIRLTVVVDASTGKTCAFGQ